MRASRKPLSTYVRMFWTELFTHILTQPAVSKCTELMVLQWCMNERFAQSRRTGRCKRLLVLPLALVTCMTCTARGRMQVPSAE